MKAIRSKTSRIPQRGVALLLVLGALILISVIVIGFMATVRQDRTSSAFYEGGSGARQYAETTVNIAIAQIAEATANPDLAWISQPGLLRTFDTTGAVAAYKLYSSGVMKVTGPYDPEAQLNTEVPGDWFNRPDEFADLNRPITVTVSGSARPVYPIVDPGATSAVEGFAIDSTNPAPPASNASYNELPMPVAWIYVRKDGSLVDYNTARTATDITARIAFWGDDETSKVNINTASDGLYYDSPVAHTKQDHDLGRFQPIAQEYQRYPGHPASTSIVSVFKELRDDTVASSRSQKAAAMTPRIGWGGSEGATKQAWLTRNLGKVDFDRLYTGLDELSFGRNSTGDWLTATTRNAAELPVELGKLSFFLTTESRGPELNIFNRPRITLWPFNKELIDPATGDSETNQKLTPEDRLIRFASEIGSNRRKLYFQREDAWDPLNDYNNIQENKDLYGYLQWLTGRPFPGNPTRTGGTAQTLQGKFTALGRDQILTQMFDYLRSQVNTMNRSYEPVGGPVYSFPQGHDLNNTGFNDRSPILIDAGNGTTKGLGSGGITLTEFIMQLYNATDHIDGTNVSEKKVDLFNNATGTGGPDGKMDSIIRKVQMVILLDYWMSINTLTSAMPRFQVKLEAPHLFLNPNPNGVPVALADQIFVRPIVSGQADDANWSTSAIDLALPSSSVNIYAANDTQLDAGGSNIHGGSLGLSYGLRYRADGKAISDFLVEDGTAKNLDSSATNTLSKYPFASRVIEVRIPLKLDASGNPLSDTITGKPAPKADPVIVGLEGVPTGSGPLNGSPASVTMYPGLLKPANPATLKAAGALSNLQSQTASNYLQKVDLVIASCQLPLPKLGPDDVLTASWTASNSPKHKYSQLADYAKRLQYQLAMPADLMMLAPTGNGTSTWIPNGKDTNAQMDSFRSYVLSSTLGSAGDYRLAATRRDLPSSWFERSAGYNYPDTYFGMSYLPTLLVRYGGPETYRVGTLSGVNPWGDLLPKVSRLVANANYNTSADERTAAPGLASALKRNNSEGDFTNGYGSKGDGAMIKGPDVGAISTDPTFAESPYFNTKMSRSSADDSLSTTDTYHLNFTGLVYSPWKQMPSAVRFGTLPSRALDGDPWETLLFNPVPAGGKASHRGWTALPRDHYWLDLFYMPTVEPYAITENFATNGKINLNAQIAPFTYIRRNTGLWALLRNTQVLAIPTTASSTYKSPTLTYANAGTETYRKVVDLSNTVAQLENRLKVNNDPFVSASEICEIPMLFDGQSAANIENHWSSLKLTGDDSREAPYNAIYPRVTTKSNTFKVHFIAQTLKGKNGKWAVVGKYRGSQIVERYLDGFSGTTASRVYGNGTQPSTQFPALAGSDGTGTPFYRFRKLSHQQFSP